MPSSTFSRLSAEKRDRVLDAAIAEFARHEFADGRLDRIAAEAGVAKGSLFQYFEDKHELYVHTVETALDRAWRFHERHVESADPANCLELLEHTLLGLAELGRREPQLAKLYVRVVFGKDSHARDRLYKTFVARNEQFFARLIPWGVETGHIDASLPENVVRFHVHAVGSQFTYLALSQEDPRWLPRGKQRLKEFAGEVVASLARALAPPRRRRRSST